MPRCGCAGQGGAVMIEAGNGVTVTGTGSASNPYRISAEQLFLSVTDTSTVNLTLGGEGTQGQPYSLQADFIGVIDPPDWTHSELRDWTTATVSLTDITTPRTLRVNITTNVTQVNLPTWQSSDSGSITLMITQDATGGRTWVQPGTSALGVKVALTPTPGARDLIILFWTGFQWVVIPSAMDVK